MKIVFTSCMDAERVPTQPIWDRIGLDGPFDVLMLLGDQIYMDWGLGGATDWRTLIADKPDKGLEAFAIDMHRRYALQWKVASFQRLICNFAGRADPSRLLVTWDDHDFAWNNSLGVDGTDPVLHKHGVPAKVKAVSRRLFDQFVNQLRRGTPGSDYPTLPGDWSATLAHAQADGLFWSGSLGSPNGPPCLLLDTRWHREARTAGASILGQHQRDSLLASVGQPGAGLLVVACGTPLNYKYLVSQQAWHDANGASYVDYDAMLRAAARPVFVLAGDVHRNAWSGKLFLSTGLSSKVVQVLSSGAAIGSYGPKRFAPSYGVVTVPDSWATAGQVNLQLWEQAKDGNWQSSLPLPPLSFTQQDWANDLQGEAASLLDAAPDQQPLSMLAARVRTSAFRSVQSIVRSSVEGGLDGLDEVYKNSGIAGASLPEPLLLQADASLGARLHFKGDIDLSAGRQGEIENLMRAAFERAVATHKKSVVLFFHGFGKSFVDSAVQGYGLRASYPDCEPIVYSWEAGRAGGVVAALTSVDVARQSALASLVSTTTALQVFNKVAGEPAFAGIAKVVLARSAGSIAVHEAIYNTGLNFGGQLIHVDRVVLSAPLLKWTEFKTGTGFKGLDRPIVVTRNRNDQTLKFADWVDGTGPILGYDPVFGDVSANKICLDFTQSPGVGRLHDYLLPHINDAQTEINNALLTQKVFDPVSAVANGLLGAGVSGVFNVLGTS